MNTSESNLSKLSGVQSTPGQSVEDKLSRFFAETSANERKQPPMPVEGSIVTFSKPPGARQATAPPLAFAPLRIQSNVTSSRQKPEPSQQKMAWSCESCTFINARRMAEVDDWLSCEMCGVIYIRKDSRKDDCIQNVSPLAFLITSKAGGEKDAGKVIDLIDGSRRPGKRNQGSPEVILIDLGEPDCRDPATPLQPKRFRCTSDAHPSVVIEIDMEGKQDANRKFSSSEVSVSPSVRPLPARGSFLSPLTIKTNYHEPPSSVPTTGDATNEDDSDSSDKDSNIAGISDKLISQTQDEDAFEQNPCKERSLGAANEGSPGVDDAAAAPPQKGMKPATEGRPRSLLQHVTSQAREGGMGDVLNSQTQDEDAFEQNLQKKRSLGAAMRPQKRTKPNTKSRPRSLLQHVMGQARKGSRTSGASPKPGPSKRSGMLSSWLARRVRPKGR